jgi:hypothetical protein
MWATIRGDGIYVHIQVNDAIDMKIVQLALMMADRNKNKLQLRLFNDTTK